MIAAAIGVAVIALSRPEYLKFFFEHEAGPGLLVVAGAFLVVGTFWMYRVTNVKY